MAAELEALNKERAYKFAQTLKEEAAKAMAVAKAEEKRQAELL